MSPTIGETPRPVTTVEAIVPIASLIVLVGLSFFLFGNAGALGPNQIAPVVATRPLRALCLLQHSVAADHRL